MVWYLQYFVQISNFINEYERLKWHPLGSDTKIVWKVFEYEYEADEEEVRSMQR